MNCRLVGLLCAMTLVFTTSGAWAWRNLVNGHCPGLSPQNSWADYMSAKFPTTPMQVNGKTYNGPSGVAGVQFDLAKGVADPDAMGNLNPKICYGVRYTPGLGYESWTGDGTNGHGFPGDPSAYEINVAGVLMLFNEAGEVLDHRGRPVGHLVCYTSNNCGGF